MALALDGSATKNITSGSSTTISLTTSNANDVVVLVVTINGSASGRTVSSVSSSNTTGWTLRKRQLATPASPAYYIEEWHGIAASALSSETITVTLSGAILFCTLTIFGISGADTTTVWDSNGALPDGASTGDRSITTSNANDFLIGAYRFSSTATPTAGTGWTAVHGANYQLVEYKIVSATQSAATVPIGTGSGNQNGGIGDAVMEAAPSYTLTADAGAYTLAGQDATLLKTRIVTADAGAYAVAGQDASVLVGHKLTADAGAYSVAGQDATLTYVPVTPGAYTLTCEAGAYVLAGQDATLLRGRVIAADAGDYLLTGAAATFAYSGAPQTATGGGGWLPKMRRKTRKEIHAERVRLGILPPDIVKAAKKAAAVVLDEPSPIKAYKAEPEAANAVFLRELGATKMLPDYRRAIKIQIEIMQQEDDEMLLFF